MEKQKTSKGIIAIIILLIVIVLALAGGMVYLFVNQNKDNNNTTNNTVNNVVADNNTNTVANNTVIEVADDLLYYGRYNTVAFIENGNVYLSRIEQESGFNAIINTIKVSGITGKVLKIRGYCIDNTPEYKYFLITDQGKVYSVGYEPTAQEETYFKDYNVVDIIGAERIEKPDYLFATKYTILTKENKKIQIDVSRGNDDTETKIKSTELK